MAPRRTKLHDVICMLLRENGQMTVDEILEHIRNKKLHSRVTDDMETVLVKLTQERDADIQRLDSGKYAMILKKPTSAELRNNKQFQHDMTPRTAVRKLDTQTRCTLNDPKLGFNIRELRTVCENIGISPDSDEPNELRKSIRDHMIVAKKSAGIHPGEILDQDVDFQNFLKVSGIHVKKPDTKLKNDGTDRKLMKRKRLVCNACKTEKGIFMCNDTLWCRGCWDNKRKKTVDEKAQRKVDEETQRKLDEEVSIETPPQKVNEASNARGISPESNQNMVSADFHALTMTAVVKQYEAKMQQYEAEICVLKEQLDKQLRPTM